MRAVPCPHPRRPESRTFHGPPYPGSGAALALIAKGDAFRLEHSGTWHVTAPDGTTIPKATVSSLVRHGWARYGNLHGIRRPLTLTEQGRALLPATEE